MNSSFKSKKLLEMHFFQDQKEDFTKHGFQSSEYVTVMQISLCLLEVTPLSCIQKRKSRPNQTRLVAAEWSFCQCILIRFLRRQHRRVASCLYNKILHRSCQPNHFLTPDYCSEFPTLGNVKNSVRQLASRLLRDTRWARAETFVTSYLLLSFFIF